MIVVNIPFGFLSFDIMTCAGAVVEFQAFRGVRYEYIIKEFAAVDLTTGRFFTELFAPPYERERLPLKVQTSNDWLQRHYHRLRWEDGHVPYKDMVPTIVHVCSRFPVIYTKGLEKSNFLRQYHHNVLDMNVLFAPSVRNNSFFSGLQCPVSLQHQQQQHKPSVQCALHNALFYAEWLRIDARQQQPCSSVVV